MTALVIQASAAYWGRCGAPPAGQEAAAAEHAHGALLADVLRLATESGAQQVLVAMPARGEAFRARLAQRWTAEQDEGGDTARAAVLWQGLDAAALELRRQGARIVTASAYAPGAMLDLGEGEAASVGGAVPSARDAIATLARQHREAATGERMRIMTTRPSVAALLDTQHSIDVAVLVEGTWMAITEAKVLAAWKKWPGSDKLRVPRPLLADFAALASLPGVGEGTALALLRDGERWREGGALAAVMAAEASAELHMLPKRGQAARRVGAGVVKALVELGQRGVRELLAVHGLRSDVMVTEWAPGAPEVSDGSDVQAVRDGAPGVRVQDPVRASVEGAPSVSDPVPSAERQGSEDRGRHERGVGAAPPRPDDRDRQGPAGVEPRAFVAHPDGTTSSAMPAARAVALAAETGAQAVPIACAPLVSSGDAYRDGAATVHAATPAATPVETCHCTGINAVWSGAPHPRFAPGCSHNEGPPAPTTKETPSMPPQIAPVSAPPPSAAAPSAAAPSVAAPAPPAIQIAPPVAAPISDAAPTAAKPRSDIDRALANMSPALAAALVHAQGEIRRVEKAGNNTFAHYRYATADDVIDEARVCLHAAGCGFMHSWTFAADASGPDGAGMRERGNGKGAALSGTIGRVHLRCRIFHTTGASIVIETSLAVVVEAGKAADKSELAAVTACLSYTLRGLLLIPRGDERGTGVDDRDNAQGAQAEPQRRAG